MKDLLAGIVFVALLLWGPIDHDGNFGMVIRFSYLIIIPIIFRISLNWIWTNKEISKKTEPKLLRIFSIIISLVLAVFAFIEAFSTTLHSDGIESRNWGNVFFLILFAIFFLSMALTKENKKAS